jgi:hypothetical protein
LVALLLALGLMAAGTARAEEASATAPKDPGAQTATVEKTPSVSKQEAPPPTTSPPADQPRPKSARPNKPLKRFRPSEEIHVDKAVDFPSDI